MCLNDATWQPTRLQLFFSSTVPHFFSFFFLVRLVRLVRFVVFAWLKNRLDPQLVRSSQLNVPRRALVLPIFIVLDDMRVRMRRAVHTHLPQREMLPSPSIGISQSAKLSDVNTVRSSVASFQLYLSLSYCNAHCRRRPFGHLCPGHRCCPACRVRLSTGSPWKSLSRDLREL